MKIVVAFIVAAMIALTSLELASLPQKLADTALSNAQARMANQALTDMMSRCSSRSRC